MRLKFGYAWEEASNGRWYVMEHYGMLRTGSFATQWDAAEWFRKELDKDILAAEVDEQYHDARAETR